MTDDPKGCWDQPITMREAYLAMVEFALTYFRVGGETEKEVEFFAAHISNDPNVFIDPALEDDWFDAVEKVKHDDAHQDRSRRTPHAGGDRR